MTTKTKTTQINAPTTVQIQAQNTQAQNTQNTQRRVISITPTSRGGVRGRPSAKPNREYITSKIRELLIGSEIDLGDYIATRVLQVYITSYTSSYAQGLVLTVARHKENSDMGLLANLALRYSIANNDIKVSVKNAIRIYEPLLSNIINLTKDLDPVFIFK